MRRPGLELGLYLALAGMAPMLASCCRAPADPSDPARSAPADSGAAWLEALSQGRDADAWDGTAPIFQTERTLEQFTERVDGEPLLREHERVEWRVVHFVVDEAEADQEWAKRCLHRLVQNVRVEATLHGAHGNTAELHMSAHRRGSTWLWKSITVDGRRLMPERQVPVRPEFNPATAATAARPRATPPKSRTPPVVAPPRTKVEGTWIIGEYEVRLDAVPEGTWVASYDASFGLALAMGDAGPFPAHRSTIEIRTMCEGSCERSTFEDRILNANPTRIQKNLRQRRKVHHTVWRQEAAEIESPSESGGRQFWFQLAGLDEAGVDVVEAAEFSFLGPPEAGRWLACSVEVEGPDLARSEELGNLCRTLEFVHRGDKEGEAIEARFGARYELGGHEVTVPTPSGFRFGNYDAVHGRLVFKGIDDMLDHVTIETGCAGSCQAERLGANLEENWAEHLEPAEDGRRPEVLRTFESFAPGRYRSRVRRGEARLSRTELEVIVLPRGADHFLRCRAGLHAQTAARANEFERLCTEVLSPIDAASAPPG